MIPIIFLIIHKKSMNRNNKVVLIRIFVYISKNIVMLL